MADDPPACRAVLCIADDYGDNSAGIRCQLPFGHDGLHQEQYKARGPGQVTITWQNDERIECGDCGAVVMPSEGVPAGAEDPPLCWTCWDKRYPDDEDEPQKPHQDP